MMMVVVTLRVIILIAAKIEDNADDKMRTF